MHFASIAFFAALSSVAFGSSIFGKSSREKLINNIKITKGNILNSMDPFAVHYDNDGHSSLLSQSRNIYPILKSAALPIQGAKLFPTKDNKIIIAHGAFKPNDIMLDEHVLMINVSTLVFNILKTANDNKITSICLPPFLSSLAYNKKYNQVFNDHKILFDALAKGYVLGIKKYLELKDKKSPKIKNITFFIDDKYGYFDELKAAIEKYINQLLVPKKA